MYLEAFFYFFILFCPSKGFKISSVFLSYSEEWDIFLKFFNVLDLSSLNETLIETYSD